MNLFFSLSKNDREKKVETQEEIENKNRLMEKRKKLIDLKIRKMIEFSVNKNILKMEFSKEIEMITKLELYLNNMSNVEEKKDLEGHKEKIIQQVLQKTG